MAFPFPAPIGKDLKIISSFWQGCKAGPIICWWECELYGILKGVGAGCNKMLKFFILLHTTVLILETYSKKVTRDTHKNVHFKDVHPSIIYNREKNGDSPKKYQTTGNWRHLVES